MYAIRSYYDETRIPAMREMIVSKDVESRKRALNKLLPMQRGDFKGIYKAMGGRPVTIRFLDPPLHEFLPSEEEDIRALAKEMNLTYVITSYSIHYTKLYDALLTCCNKAFCIECRLT